MEASAAAGAAGTAVAFIAARLFLLELTRLAHSTCLVQALRTAGVEGATSIVRESDIRTASLVLDSGAAQLLFGRATLSHVLVAAVKLAACAQARERRRPYYHHRHDARVPGQRAGAGSSLLDAL